MENISMKDKFQGTDAREKITAHQQLRIKSDIFSGADNREKIVVHTRKPKHDEFSGKDAREKMKKEMDAPARDGFIGENALEPIATKSVPYKKDSVIPTPKSASPDNASVENGNPQTTLI